MKPWDLKKTYSLVKAMFDQNQMRLVRDSTQSILDRQAFARYHYQEAIRLSKSFERKYLTNGSILEIYTHENEQKRAAFELYIIKAGAHATAAIQSLHALPDILAHVIYFASGQNLGPNALQDKDISHPSVARLLKRNRKFHSLAPLLESMHAGELWPHLAAVANLSKHRSVIRPALSEDWTGNRKNFRELQFQSFKRKGKYYAALSLQALIEPEYTRSTHIILAVGQRLNSCLQQQAISSAKPLP